MAKKSVLNMIDERYGLFQSEESFNLDIGFGRDYLEQDVNFKITLYRVNILKSKSRNLYGQSEPEDKSYFPPVVLNAMVTIEDGKQETYGGDAAGLMRDDSGNIKIGIYLEELKEKKTEINRGDIIMYNMSGEKNRYYEVDNANNIIDESSKTKGGYKPYWKEIIAFPCKSDVTAMFEKS